MVKPLKAQSPAERGFAPTLNGFRLSADKPTYPQRSIYKKFCKGACWV